MQEAIHKLVQVSRSPLLDVSFKNLLSFLFPPITPLILLCHPPNRFNSIAASLSNPLALLSNVVQFASLKRGGANSSIFTPYSSEQKRHPLLPRTCLSSCPFTTRTCSLALSLSLAVPLHKLQKGGGASRCLNREETQTQDLCQVEFSLERDTVRSRRVVI